MSVKQIIGMKDQPLHSVGHSDANTDNTDNTDNTVPASTSCPGLRPGMPHGPAGAAGAAGLQTLHTKLPHITPSMTISSNKEQHMGAAWR